MSSQWSKNTWRPLPKTTWNSNHIKFVCMWCVRQMNESYSNRRLWFTTRVCVWCIYSSLKCSLRTLVFVHPTLFLFIVLQYCNISEHFMNNKERTNVIFCPVLGKSYGRTHTLPSRRTLLAAWIDMLFNQNEQSYAMWQLKCLFFL